ncbi:MAG: hypothetical protein FD166_1441 [Bacteroidetes bacterium]|nr:MAG: hypothetical protein FD166_1441 [Bacteroidota bacterium]
MKEKVFNWIQQGCDFNEGLTLLSAIGKNKQIARAMAGHEKRYAGKLFYELCKAAGYTMVEYQKIKDTLQDIVNKLDNQSGDNPPADDPPADDPPTGSTGDNPDTTGTSAEEPFPADEKKEEVTSEEPAQDTKEQEEPVKVPSAAATVKEQGQEKEGQLPADVEKVIREHADLFKLRAQLHEQMAELPEDNTEENIKKRKNLSDSIALISPRIDLMFAAKEVYYNEGRLPEMSVLFPEPKVEPPAVEELPADPKELKKMKKNLQSANTKDQNMLDFQEEKKASKPNPMPKGPKRIKLEARIKERLDKITLIDSKLLEIAG